MPSELVERIITACEAAVEQGAKIPKGECLGDLAWGVFSEQGFFRPSGGACCPLGAVLLGRRNIHELPNYFIENVVSALSVTEDWVRGFIRANPKKDSRDRDFSAWDQVDFQAGWSVALEVLTWVNSQAA